MNDISMQVAEMYMTGIYSKNAIAQKLGIHPSRIDKILKEEATVAYMDARNSEKSFSMKNRLRTLADKALQKMDKLLDSDQEWVVMQASQTILNLYMRNESGTDTSVTINFNASMPQPALPDENEIQTSGDVS